MDINNNGKMPDELATLLMTVTMQSLEKDYSSHEELSERLAKICSLLSGVLKDNGIQLGEGFLALCVTRDQAGYQILNKMKSKSTSASTEWFKDFKFDDPKQ